MCPMCLTTAAMIAGSIAATGGLAAVAIKTFGGKDAADIHCTTSQPTEAPPSSAPAK